MNAFGLWTNILHSLPSSSLLGSLSKRRLCDTNGNRNVFKVKVTSHGPSHVQSDSQTVRPQVTDVKTEILPSVLKLQKCEQTRLVDYMSTQNIVKNIFVVFLSLLDSQLVSIPFCQMYSQWKSVLQTARDSSHAKQPVAILVSLLFWRCPFSSFCLWE